MNNSRVHCILPPILLDQIARNGTEEQRRWALDTLAQDQSFRAARIQGLAFRLAAARSPSPTESSGKGRPHRTIRDAHHEQNLSGQTVRKEGQPATQDLAVDEAYAGLGSTYDFFWEVFNRDSIDDHGLLLDGVVHYSRNYDNAFWDGKQMVFGDGDGDLFNRFTISLEVIGHELTHGVTEHEAGLAYTNQSGALNESLSDVFGSLVKQHHLKQKASDADWLIGSGLLTRKVKGVALRSMKAPGTAYDDPVLGKDPQPGHMDAYVKTNADNGGVHINSGIPNRAFYLLATQLGGFAWERAGRIWYETLTSPELQTHSQFTTFASQTHHTATRLYGRLSAEAMALKQSWREVGIQTD